MERANEVDNYKHRPLAPIGCKPLAIYLLEAGLLTESQMTVAGYDKRATGMSLSEIVVMRGWIKQELLDDLYEKVIIPERMRINQEILDYKHSFDRQKFKKRVMSLQDWVKSKGLSNQNQKDKLPEPERSIDAVEWTRD